MTIRTRNNKALRILVVAFSMFLSIGGSATVHASEPPGEISESQEASQELISKIVTRSLEKYRSLTTYQDKVTMALTMISKDEDGEEVPQEHASEGTISFLRPNRMALISDDTSVVCDGKQLWVHRPQFGQYTVTEVSEKLDLLEQMGDSSMGSTPVHPVALVMTTEGEDLLKIAPAIKSLDRIEEAERNGRPGHRIHGIIEFGEPMPDTPLSFDFWIDEETGLLRELHIDLTPMYKQFGADAPEADEEEEAFSPPKIETAQMVLSFDEIVLNAEIPADRFVFKPGEDDRKVSEFFFAGQDQTKQLELIGKPAPLISGKDLEDKPFSLADLKGKVVVLDFWATWCSPCVQAMPSMQKISERYADKPVVLVGINRDAEGQEKAVRKLLKKKKKIQFRQYMDADGKAGEAYCIRGIPCTVLIDKEGVIQDIETGFSGEDALSEKIDDVLKGKPIHDAEELAVRIKEMKAYADEEEEGEGDDTTVATSAGLEEYLEDRLVKGERIGGQVNGHQMRKFDVDGDGQLELILPDWQGSLTIISASGSEHRRVRLKGAGRRRSLTAFEPVRKGDDVLWLVAFSEYTGSSMAQKVSVALYDAEGTRLWSYRPDLPSKLGSDATIAAGDLTGDGAPEMVVGLNTFKMQRQGSNNWSHGRQRGYLLVFDEQGNRLCQRRLGRRLDFVSVMPAVQDGQGPAVICGGDSELRTYRLDLSKAQPSEHTEPENAAPKPSSDAKGEKKRADDAADTGDVGGE